jgi:hypothetical protein
MGAKNEGPKQTFQKGPLSSAESKMTTQSALTHPLEALNLGKLEMETAAVPGLAQISFVLPCLLYIGCSKD